MATVITDDRITDTYPVPRPDPAPPGRPPADVSTSAPATQENLVNEWWSPYVGDIREIPADAKDDLRQDIGPTVYREKMMRDPAVSAAVITDTLITLAQELDILPLALSGDANYEQDLLFVKHCKAQIEQLEQPFHELLFEMYLSASIDGHKIAEIVLEVKTLDEAAGPQYWLKALKTKPHESYSLAQDANNNLYGYVPRATLRGRYKPVMTVRELGASNVLPRSKFLHYTNHPKDGNLIGTSRLRPIFHSWWLKTQMWASYVPYLAISAEPIFVYEQDKDGPATWPVVGADGRTTTVDTRVYAKTILSQVRGKKGIFMPKGDKGKFLSPPANGDVFDAAFTRFNAEIVKGYTLQELATDQGEHSSRAQASVHQDNLGLNPRHGRRMLAHMVRGLFKLLLLFNYGPKAVQRAPVAQLGQTEQWDLSKVGQVFAQLLLAKGVFPSQMKAMFAGVGLPPPSDADINLYTELFWAQMRTASMPKQLAEPAPAAANGANSNA